MLVELRFPRMLSLFFPVLPVIKQEPSYRQFLFYSQYSISFLLLISIHLLTEFQFFLQSVHHLIFRDDFWLILILPFFRLLLITFFPTLSSSFHSLLRPDQFSLKICQPLCISLSPVFGYLPVSVIKPICL